MTAAQFRSTAVAVLEGLGLTPTRWAQGGIASSTLTVACTTLASLSTQLSNAIAQQWNPTASGGGLQLLSQYFYGITPPQATFASGMLTLVNAGGGVFTFSAGQAIFQSLDANAAGIFPQYTNTSPFTLNALATLTIPINCTIIGTPGNANPGRVTNIISSMIGVTCSNALAIVGQDPLSDAALRALNTSSIGVRGSAFGPRSAYAYAISVATNSITGLPVNVNRQAISISSHTGTVTIYVASPTGPVISSDITGINTSIDALARPDAVTVNVFSAVSLNYSPTITVYIVAPSGTTSASLQTLIVTALTAYFSGPSNPIGGLTGADDGHGSFNGIFESGVTGIIGAAVVTVPGCYVLSTKFAGTSDLALTPGEVATWAGTVIVNVQYVTG